MNSFIHEWMNSLDAFSFWFLNSLLASCLLNYSCQEDSVMLCHTLSCLQSFLWVIIAKHADWLQTFWSFPWSFLSMSAVISCHAESCGIHWATFLFSLIPYLPHRTWLSPWSVKKIMPKRVLSALVYTLELVAPPLVPIMAVEKLPLGDFCLEIACHSPAIPHRNHLFCMSRTSSFWPWLQLCPMLIQG